MLDADNKGIIIKAHVLKKNHPKNPEFWVYFLFTNLVGTIHCWMGMVRIWWGKEYHFSLFFLLQHLLKTRLNELSLPVFFLHLAKQTKQLLNIRTHNVKQNISSIQVYRIVSNLTSKLWKEWPWPLTKTTTLTFDPGVYCSWYNVIVTPCSERELTFKLVKIINQTQ